MKNEKLLERFFARNAKIVARDLLGKILVRKLNGKELRARVVETEAYFDEKDPASWARFGKRKDNSVMWEKAGMILIKNVHKYFMLNFVTGKEGKAEAVLIRAIEPVNFMANTCGPGLLTISLKIDKRFHGKDINNKELWFEDSRDKFEIVESFRIGVIRDISEKLRFYIKGNKCISRK